MTDTKSIHRVTDAQLLALDDLMTQTHRLYGMLDVLGGHPMLTDEQQELVSEMFSLANRLDNMQHDRLQTAKSRRNIDGQEHVEDHVDITRPR